MFMQDKYMVSRNQYVKYRLTHRIKWFLKYFVLRGDIGGWHWNNSLGLFWKLDAARDISLQVHGS